MTAPEFFCLRCGSTSHLVEKCPLESDYELPTMADMERLTREVKDQPEADTWLFEG